MDYLYANGIIKAIDNNVLDKNRLSKLLHLDKQSLLKTLTDMGYGSNDHNDNLEDLINSELSKVKTLLESISPNKEFTDLFFLQYDALNIKILWKMKIFKLGSKKLLVDYGSIDKEVLSKAILEDDYGEIKPGLKSLLKSISDKVSELNNPRLVSAYIDNSVYSYAFKQLGMFPNKNLKPYFEVSIDIANVLTLVRSLKLNWDVNQYLEMFIDGGKVSKNTFIDVYGSSNDAIVKAVSDFYGNRLAIGLSSYFTNKDLDKLEKYYSELLLIVMKDYEYDSFNIGPLIYYYLKKQAEANNIRLIYADSNIELNGLIEY